MRKDRAKNLLLLCSAIVVGYAVLDFLVWRNLLQLVPLKLHPELGRLEILAQSSKHGIVPRDYILMIGDSYAEGLGDWRMEVGGGGNPDFHSAHLLFNRTGRDVVTFGIRGGDPTFAFVYNTTRTFEGLQLYATYDIRPPKDVLAFFYEGNDIADEIAGLRDLPGDFDQSRLTSGDYYYRNSILKLARDGREKASRRWHFLRNAHLLDTFTKLVKYTVKSARQGRLFQTAKYHPNWSRYRNTPNFVRAGGKVLPFPDALAEPFAFHSREDIVTAAFIFRESLRYLKNYFGTATLWVVYIPAPVNVYDPAGPMVLRNLIYLKNRFGYGPRTTFAPSELAVKSDFICNRIYQATHEIGARFIDTRVVIRDAARRNGYLHGPKDPIHFNRRGYAALAKAIAAGMEGDQAKKCATLNRRGSF